MVKVSANRYVMLRVEAIRRETEAHTQKLRRKLLKNLEEIFQQASKIVKGETKHQRIRGKMAKITLRQRRKWLLIAACTAETITMISENINEKEIKSQLEKLEKLVREATNQTKSNRLLNSI